MGEGTMTWGDLRGALDAFSERIGEWQGVPVPLDDLPVRLHDRHPLRDVFDGGEAVAVLVGGPPMDAPLGDDASMDEVITACHATWEDEQCVNHWYDAARNRDVFIFRRENGRAFAVTAAASPDQSMDRLTYWVRTIGAVDAWDLAAEHRAREKLRSMVSEHQWRQYDLTGAFLESSPRSRLLYVFRRLRPTVVLTPRHRWWLPDREAVRCLAVLCMHPVGYYDQTWAGCMVPTDDVIAHLLMMRGDEAYLWRKANQHDPQSPEAGL